ncbi:PucR family transcriptional regulator [Millisia brevis]|uniref:PucR family transcriptional regulator n=1 Tax=Millisia brevis TaxID=264148 RepID=UPI000A05239F|nr:helix-turn-helix domain-containing protein [Millisia brevis]
MGEHRADGPRRRRRAAADGAAVPSAAGRRSGTGPTTGANPVAYSELDHDLPIATTPSGGREQVPDEIHLSGAFLAAPRYRGDDDSHLPDALLRRVKQFSSRLSREAIETIRERLPFFDNLDAAQKASVHLLVQAAVDNFLEWLTDPDGDITFTSNAIPKDLARSLTLRQTVDMVRVATECFEKWLPALARTDQQLVALTEAVLRYGREIGFATASVYADAAEARGAWDTRLEAMVVDAVVRGDTSSDIVSRAATLNWDVSSSATVLVGSPPPEQGVSVVGTMHDVAARHGRAALAVVQGSRLVVLVSGPLFGSPGASAFLHELMTIFSSDPVVIGPTTRSLATAHSSAAEALAGMVAVHGWRGAPRPVYAGELLPERALLGDPAAVTALLEQIVSPLAKAGSSLSDTLDAYLDSGGAVETCARQLFVHPNTVRYRLRRVTEVTGRDPTDSRDAYVLRVAATVGRLGVSPQEFGSQVSSSTSGPIGPFSV